jgi:hypothetical protein
MEVERRQSVSITGMLNRGWRLEVMQRTVLQRQPCGRMRVCWNDGEYDEAVYMRYASATTSKPK